MVVEVAPGLNPAVDIPGHGVNHPWLYENHTNWTDPGLSLFGVRAHGLLDLKLSPTLLLDMRDGHSQSRDIKLFVLALWSSATFFAPSH